MPDFDEFERLIRKAMTEPCYGLSGLTPRLAAIPRQHRPQLFKNRTKPELEMWIQRACQKLADLFGVDSNFRTSDLNIKGSDLTVIETGKEIELKTGKVTDANIGLSTVAWMMGDKDNAELRSIMSDSMKDRCQLALSGDFEGVRASQEKTMERLYIYFRERLSEGTPAPDLVAHCARAVAHGFTKKDEISSLQGQPESKWPVRTVLHANWREGWIEVRKPFDKDETIIVDQIFRGANTRSKIARAQAKVRGITSGRTVLIYPNYKNSYKSKASGRKVEAKHWVKTACFHLWIDK